MAEWRGAVSKHAIAEAVELPRVEKTQSMLAYNDPRRQFGVEVMSRTLAGHFDGKVIIPEKPVKLPVGKRPRIHVELDEPKNGVLAESCHLLGQRGAT